MRLPGAVQLRLHRRNALPGAGLDPRRPSPWLPSVERAIIRGTTRHAHDSSRGAGTARLPGSSGSTRGTPEQFPRPTPRGCDCASDPGPRSNSSGRGCRSRTVRGSQRPDPSSRHPSHPVALEARLRHPWTLKELAADLHVSPSYLLRIFKSSTGLPPMAYLAKRRVETAAEMLLHGDESMSEIGQTVGWPDQNYFARRFKAHFGLSGTRYRERFARSARQLKSLA